MKNRFLLTIALSLLTFFFAALGRAQSCANGQSVNPTALKFNSESFTATLIGFSEFTNPSVPAKKYRRKAYSGTAEFDTYSGTCSGSLTYAVSCTLSGACQYDPVTGVLTSTFAQFCNGGLNAAGGCGSLAPTSGRGVTTDQTSQQAYPTPECYQNGKSVADTYRIQLSDEDKDQDAEQRAAKVSGTSNIVFRTTRTTGFTFGASKTHVSAAFKACPGDYIIYLVYSASNSSIGPQRKQIGTQHTESGEFTVERDFEVGTDPFVAYNVNYSVLNIVAELQCSGENGGDSGSGLNSVDFWVSLGRTSGDASAGQLRIEADKLTSAIYTSVSLKLVSTQSTAVVQPVLDPSGALRQAKAPQALADIATLDANSYEVRFYTADQIGAQDSTSNIYAITGTPFVTYKFENPDPAAAQPTRLHITETRGSLEKVTEYSYDSATNNWVLSKGGGLRNESLTTTTVANGDVVKTRTITNSANETVSKVADTYHNYSWGLVLTSHVLDPDGAALTTTYSYYQDPTNDGSNYRQLKQRLDANGFLERFTYSAAGDVLKSIRPFLNASATTTDESLCRVTENIFDTVADLDGDGVAETRKTTIERVLGQETARRYRIDWTKAVTLNGDNCTRRSDIVCVVAGAAWNAAANLVTETLRYAAGPFVERERRVTNPNGTVVLDSYTRDASGQETLIAKTGQPNAALDDIIDGLRTVTLTSAAGQTTSETVTHISSNLELSSWTATQFDGLNRPTRLDYTDGTFTTRDYACCGLSSTRDRSGLFTSYVYNGLGQQTDITSDGITIHTTYDADGRVKSVTRLGTDNSSMVQSTSVYDIAGRLIEQRDALNRLTTFGETFDAGSGQTTRTLTAPGGTSVELRARDGSSLSLSGTAVAPRSYEYGVDAAGVFTKQILVGESGSTSEWVKTYTDFAGRGYKTVMADNATTQSYFNTIGQLVRQVDPDGVTTLFAYNARGEQEITAVDMDGDGVIDFDGTDRITKTVTAVAARGAYTVQRNTTQVWETDGQNTPTTISISEFATDGLHSWQTVRGLTTSTVTVLDGSGGRTVTTTTPDDVQTVQVYAGNLLTSTTVKTAADVQLASVTYGYDQHHRSHTATDARNGTTSYTYFADDQIQSVTAPDPDTSRTGAGYDPQTTSYTYDSAGRVDTVTQPDTGVVNTTYWPTGAVKRTWGSGSYPIEYTYDPQGRVKTLTTWQNFAGDTGKAVTTWNYDPARGWLQNKRYPDNTGPSYTYKSSGRLLTRAWARTPVITTTYGYNAAGGLSGIDYSDATPDVALAYDRVGRPKTVTDGSGSRTLAYHASGQLQDETYTAGLMNTLAVNRTFDSLNRVHGLFVPSVSSVTYDYDAASRLQTVTNGTNTATYAYVTNSPLVESVTFANAGTTRLTTAKTYDKLNRVVTIANTPSSAPVFSHAYTYNAANQRTRATREDNAYWSYGYDALGQVTSGKKFLADGTAVLGLESAWTFDDIGNRITATANGAASTYTPNTLNQYTLRSVPGAVDVLGASDAAATVTVGVNNGTPQSTARQGELFYKQVTVDNSVVAQNPSLKITGVRNLIGPNGEDAVSEIARTAFVAKTPEDFTYDTDGNLTDDARWHYTWDGENRLVAIETSSMAASVGVLKQKLEFTYDIQGRRMQKKVSAWNTGTNIYQLVSDTRFVYDGWNLLADLNGQTSNAVVCTYAWGLDLSGSPQGAGGVGGLIFSTLNGQSAVYAYGSDGNGNVTGLVAMGTGAKSATYDYSVFGEVLTADGPSAGLNTFRFSTKYTDAETGRFYYGFRYYDPSTGRWLSRDPSEEQGGINLYAFVANDALGSVDALGLATKRCVTDRINIDLDSDTVSFAKILNGRSVKIGGKLQIRGEIKRCRVCCAGQESVSEDKTVTLGVVVGMQAQGPIGDLFIPGTSIGLFGTVQIQGQGNVGAHYNPCLDAWDNVNTPGYFKVWGGLRLNAIDTKIIKAYGSGEVGGGFGLKSKCSGAHCTVYIVGSIGIRGRVSGQIGRLEYNRIWSLETSGEYPIYSF